MSNYTLQLEIQVTSRWDEGQRLNAIAYALHIPYKDVQSIVARHKRMLQQVDGTMGNRPLGRRLLAIRLVFGQNNRVATRQNVEDADLEEAVDKNTKNFVPKFDLRQSTLKIIVRNMRMWPSGDGTSLPRKNHHEFESHHSLQNHLRT